MQTAIVKPVQSIRASQLLDGDHLLGPVTGIPRRVTLVECHGSTVHVHRQGLTWPLVLPAQRVVRIIPG